MGGSQTFQGAWSLSCTSFQAHTCGARFRSADSDLLGAACIFETHAHFVPPPESTRIEQGCVHGRREWFGLIINGAEVWRDLEPWRLGTLAAISMILGSGSRDLQTHQGKSWPGMHRVCLSDFSTDATHKTFGLIPSSRTLSGVRTLAYGT